MNTKEILGEFVKIVAEHKKSLANMPGKMRLSKYFKDCDENAHSKTLTFLLNPKEEHRHGAEYLRSFLGYLRQERGLAIPKDEEIDFKNASVEREKQANGRRIDIFVKLNKDTCLIIENKIWAGDQPDQLKDYCKWAKDEYSTVIMLYLNLYGSNPTEKSIDEESRKEWEACGEYATLSYAYDILSWLRRLHVRLDEKILASGLEQYIHTLEVLTNQTENQRSMKKDILELLTESYEKRKVTSGDMRLLGESAMRASAIVPILDVWKRCIKERPEIEFTENPESFAQRLIDNNDDCPNFRIEIKNPAPKYSDLKGCFIAYEHWISSRTHYYGVKKGTDGLGQLIDIPNFNRADWSADFPDKDKRHSRWWHLHQDLGEAKPEEIAEKIIALYNKIHGTS